MTTRRSISITLFVLAGLSSAAAAGAPSLCATAEQMNAVRALYVEPPFLPPFLSAPKLALPEAIVLSALPAGMALGVPGSEFHKVWDSLRGWERSVTLVLKAGQVFEIAGRIPAGKPSTVSQNFNLDYPPAGLGGHLRPDLISAIYAIRLQGREGPVRGVSFLDPNGDGAFGVFLPESQQPTAAEQAQFDATWALMADLPRACPPQ